MVVRRGTRPETVVKVDKTDAQTVSPSTTTCPLGAPNLPSPHYYRVRTAECCASGHLGERAKGKRREKDAA